MDLIKTILLVTSQMGTYLLLVSSQQAQLTAQFRRNSRITSFILQQDSTVYYAYFNVNRQNYGHTKKTSDEQKNSTKTALQNKNFRQALNFALDRTSYSAQANGKEGASRTLRTLLVPPTFVQARRKRLRYAR